MYDFLFGANGIVFNGGILPLLALLVASIAMGLAVYAFIFSLTTRNKLKRWAKDRNVDADELADGLTNILKRLDRAS